MAEEKSRDARRRRRILQEGSDRLAFITGRIQRLPDPNTTSVHHPQPPPQPEISTAPTPQPEPEPQPEAVRLQPQPRSQRLITPSDISGAIYASRGRRLCCSVLVALLVLASYSFGIPISFRPLYLLLLTNLTLLIAYLFSAQNRGSSGEGLGQLAKTLELCLLLRSVADAVFIDCAVYSLVLVCGLSLLRTINHQILLFL
ncbi:uncharacterized protein LOC109815256 [Cajanus cajan]|uniref:Uncharacterized protein n=1 Tax=Cajanus cajan TaxID=3821 RepID=A0A151RWG4_CAJCA|nr:uncharacterized protein LOC109815256 [Cajanus cajan]KYP46892.1 hypothetical protein KK1_031462 [Cajanus cajan]